MDQSPGLRFRNRMTSREVLPLVGVYDAFSAKLAAERFEGVFCSGFSFAASALGLPDIGFMTWRDIADFALRIRHLLPQTHLLVDVDDGFGDENIAAEVIAHLEMIGVSAVMFEDQKRPRRCGHYEGKEILPANEYLTKLRAVLKRRKDLFVIARTDATNPLEAMERARAYAEEGADGVMVEAVKDLDLIAKLTSQVKVPVMVNQLHGGKSPNWTLSELQSAGVGIVIYSTPCLFVAQYAIERYLDQMRLTGKLPSEGTVGINQCNEVLFPKPKIEEAPCIRAI